LKGELAQQDDKYMRLKAEFDNYRRRKSQEIIDLLKYDGENVVKDFLSILDDLDRLKEASSDIKSPDVSKISEGIDLIINKINKQFEELGVVQFTKVGDVVDPELHDALMMRNEDGKEENTILEVFEKGYRYKDRVIRHAKVVVNQTPS
jgi:molecular chaperone GrpE